MTTAMICREALTIEAVADAIRSHQISFANEDDLQRGLYEILLPLGARREVRIGASARFDLLVSGVVVEAKLGGSANELLRQLHRYAGLDSVSGIVAVVAKPHLAPKVISISGKPVRTVMVGRWM